jgi:hypothetical protein
MDKPAATHRITLLKRKCWIDVEVNRSSMGLDLIKMTLIGHIVDESNYPTVVVECKHPFVEGKKLRNKIHWATLRFLDEEA